MAQRQRHDHFGTTVPMIAQLERARRSIEPRKAGARVADSNAGARLAARIEHVVRESRPVVAHTELELCRTPCPRVDPHVPVRVTLAHTMPQRVLHERLQYQPRNVRIEQLRGRIHDDGKPASESRALDLEVAVERAAAPL